MCIRDRIQTLLRTGGHEDVVSAGLDIELRFHAIGDLLAEVLKTVGAGVLERDLALFIKDRKTEEEIACIGL